MILIAISWFYIFFTTINLGVGFNKIIKTNSFNTIVISFLGLFSTTILASFWALFGRINIEFYLFFVVLNLLIYLKFKDDVKKQYSVFFTQLKELSTPFKISLLLIVVLILAQCSAAPFIIDNESYYVQTIKWINEYGFVKGLANLHIFLGQTSGWHVTQSAFNFSFLYKNFNDLSGFCLLLGNIYSIIKLDSYFKNNTKNNLIVGLFPIANVFFFQFISAPSPDIAIYVLSFILFYTFLETYKNTTIYSFNLITVLVLFILYIKFTSIGFLLFPILILGFNFKKIFPKLLPISLIGFFILFLFIAKNSIISGYPFFPSTSITFTNIDFNVPTKIVLYFYELTQLYAFDLTKSQFHAMSFFEIALKWLFLSKLKGVLNSLTLLVLIGSPYFIYKYFNKKEYWILYAVVFTQLLILMFSSPQFRFFIHFTLFFSFLIVSCFLEKRQFIISGLFVSILATIGILFLNLNYSALTKNKLISKNSPFSIENIIFPHSNSKSKGTYKTIKKGNLIYNSPLENSFFWAAGNGELPCINEVQIQYFEKKFGMFPQMRTHDLKDGFISKQTSKNE